MAKNAKACHIRHGVNRRILRKLGADLPNGCIIARLSSDQQLLERLRLGRTGQE